MKEQPYLIFRGTVSWHPAKQENIIGNLLLKTAKAIHAENIISIDHEKRYIFVKKDPKYTK